jgi:hypothetical protein
MFSVCIRNVPFLITAQYIPDIHRGGKLHSSVVTAIQNANFGFTVSILVFCRACKNGWCKTVSQIIMQVVLRYSQTAGRKKSVLSNSNHSISGV